MKINGQDKILKTLKSNISKTVRDRDKMKIEDFDVERLKTLRDRKGQ